MNWSGVLGTPVKPLESGTPKVMDLPAFDGYADPKKLDVISKIAENAGRDPQLATVAVGIFRQAGVRPRDYRGQAAALLRWVQDNIYYVNEPDERLQDPFYTLKVKYGDCDDLAILVYALARSVRLPARLVISGTTKSGKKVRYHHGDRSFDRSVDWSHIYLMIGDRPYGEPRWAYAEPTLNVPLGWDVVSHNGNILPEMTKTPSYGYAMAGIPSSSNYVTDFTSPLRPSRAPVSPGSYIPKPPVAVPSYVPVLPPTSTYTPPPSYVPPGIVPGGYNVGAGGGYVPPAITPGGYNLTPDASGGYVPPAITPGGYNLTPDVGAGGGYTLPDITPGGYNVDPRTGLPQRGGEPGMQMGGDVNGAANAVGIVVMNRNGKVLLLKRAPDREYMPNVWDLPGAKVDERLPARPQAARVLLEETGLSVPVSGFSPLLTAYHPNAGTVMFFVADISRDKELALTSEHVAARFVDINEAIADMMVMPYMPLVFDALRRMRGGLMPKQYGAADDGGAGFVGYGVGVLLAAGIAGYLLGQWQLSSKYK